VETNKKNQVINVAENRKARHRYHIEDRFEAGIVLMGSEVKSLRDGKCQLVDSYGMVKGKQCYIVGMHIGAYSHGGYANHEPTRERKLLLHRNEIEKIKDKLTRRGYTLIPLNVYFKDGYAKVEMALATGKDIGDKRQDIKERETAREMDKAIKSAKRR